MRVELIHIHDAVTIAKMDSCPGPRLGGTVLLGWAIPYNNLFDSTTELPLLIMVTPPSATNLTVDVGMDGLRRLSSSSLIWSGSSGHLSPQPPLADRQPPNSRRAFEYFRRNRH